MGHADTRLSSYKVAVYKTHREERGSLPLFKSILHTDMSLISATASTFISARVGTMPSIDLNIFYCCT